MRPSPHRRYRSSSRASSHVGAAVMIPSIVAGNIGGWSPVERPANPSPGSSKTPPVDTVPSEGPPDGNMTGLALVQSSDEVSRENMSDQVLVQSSEEVSGNSKA